MVAGLFEFADDIALVLPLGGEEELLSAAEDEIDLALILQRNAFFVVALGLNGGKAGGRGVGDGGGGDQGGTAAGVLDQGQDGRELGAVGQDVDGGVENAAAGAPGRGRGRGVRDGRIQRGHILNAAGGMGVVDHGGPAGALLAGQTRIVFRHHEDAIGHAIGDAEDDVLRLTAFGLGQGKRRDGGQQERQREKTATLHLKLLSMILAGVETEIY